MKRIGTVRVGRPRKDQTEEDLEKMAVVDSTIKQLQFSQALSEEQLEELTKVLESTFSNYNLTEKESESTKVKSTKDINIDMLDKFLQAKRIESKSETTIYNYGNEISKMMITINKPYFEITTEDIREYMSYRKIHDNVSNVTVHNIRMYLMSFFKYLFIEEKIKKNPMDKIGVVKQEKRVVGTLTDEEQEIIRCACNNERDLAIVDLLSASGMRVSELTGLNKSDVNFETGEIKVFGKGSKERICYMTGRAKVHLRWYLEQRVDVNEALFVSNKKPYQRLTKNGIEFLLKNISKNTGIPRSKLHPHIYRATLATNMYNKGASIEDISKVLGHANSQVTSDCYIRTSNNTVKQKYLQYNS